MNFTELKNKALSLPLEPGVYVMRDKSDKVIYVGKAKKLKNRVSQYFHDSASHSPKTSMMVSHIDHFDVIVATTEFEALVLECSLIKKHMPKYNILLKDDKGYPYIRLGVREEYPTIQLSNKIDNDGAQYFGPFGSRGVTNQLIESLKVILKLPQCKRKFPTERNSRPCLHYHMGQCEGWCRQGSSRQDYLKAIESAKLLLQGNYKKLADQIRAEMLTAAEEMNFELASVLRDRLLNIETLGKKQFVTTGALADTDVIGYGQRGTKACFTVLHYRGGNLLDKDYEVFSVPDDAVSAVSSLVSQYYLSIGYVPKKILLPFPLDDTDTLSEVLTQQYSKKTRIFVPQRGESLRLTELACKNAQEEATRASSKDDRIRGSLSLLGKMLSIPAPVRMESFDISNISGTDIVAGMVVFVNGKPKKSDYKRFKIEDLSGQDDYAAMEQVLVRRFHHYKRQDPGFDCLPDLLLIDGGQTHVAVATRVLQELNLCIPTFGMVKDNKHHTRALVSSDGKEISIISQQSVFALIGTIQEETHRFAITYHRFLRSKRLHRSQLDQISGIGPKRKEDLLKKFGSIKAIRSASVEALSGVIPKQAAKAVYDHFHNNKKGEQ